MNRDSRETDGDKKRRFSDSDRRIDTDRQTQMNRDSTEADRDKKERFQTATDG